MARYKCSKHGFIGRTIVSVMRHARDEHSLNVGSSIYRSDEMNKDFKYYCREHENIEYFGRVSLFLKHLSDSHDVKIMGEKGMVRERRRIMGEKGMVRERRRITYAQQDS